MTHIQPVQQYTKQGPSARRKRLDCWDEDYAVHSSCKRNVKGTKGEGLTTWEAEIQIFDRLRDLKGVMNGKWRTYSAKHSTINIMLSHIHLILQGVSNMPGAWPMGVCSHYWLNALIETLPRCFFQNGAPSIKDRFYSAVNLWWLASNMTWPTTVIFPNSGGPFQMGISMSTWRMMFQSLSDQQMQRWKVDSHQYA